MTAHRTASREAAFQSACRSSSTPSMVLEVSRSREDGRGCLSARMERQCRLCCSMAFSERHSARWSRGTEMASCAGGVLRGSLVSQSGGNVEGALTAKSAVCRYGMIVSAACCSVVLAGPSTAETGRRKAASELPKLRIRSRS